MLPYLTIAFIIITSEAEMLAQQLEQKETFKAQ